jgi:hypothetical protein
VAPNEPVDDVDERGKMSSAGTMGVERTCEPWEGEEGGEEGEQEKAEEELRMLRRKHLLESRTSSLHVHSEVDREGRQSRAPEWAEEEGGRLDCEEGRGSSWPSFKITMAVVDRSPRPDEKAMQRGIGETLTISALAPRHAKESVGRRPGWASRGEATKRLRPQIVFAPLFLGQTQVAQVEVSHGWRPLSVHTKDRKGIERIDKEIEREGWKDTVSKPAPKMDWVHWNGWDATERERTGEAR